MSVENLTNCVGCPHPVGAHTRQGCHIPLCKCMLVASYEAYEADRVAVAWEQEHPTYDESQPSDLQNLASAVELASMVIAESIKYAVDTWAERNPLPAMTTKKSKAKWEPAVVGDLIIPNGSGVGPQDPGIGKTMMVTSVVPALDNNPNKAVVYWEGGGGCYNIPGRFDYVIDEG